MSTLEHGDTHQTSNGPSSHEAAEAAGDGFMQDLLQGEGCSVPQAEIDRCVATLRALRYDDLLLHECAALLEVGQRLFKRHVLQAEFGRQDVLEYMREKHEHQQMLRKLQKLQAQIAEQHHIRCQEAKQAGINRQRHERLRAIQDRPQPLLTAVAPVTAAADPLALPAPDDSADADANANSEATAASAEAESAAEGSPCEAGAPTTAPVALGVVGACADASVCADAGERVVTASAQEVDALCDGVEAAEPLIAAAAAPSSSAQKVERLCNGAEAAEDDEKEAAAASAQEAEPVCNGAEAAEPSMAAAAAASAQEVEPLRNGAEAAEPSIAAAAAASAQAVEPLRNGAEAAEPSIEEIRAAAALPQGSFRRFCNICKQRYSQLHDFYHQLCPECAGFNWEKRVQSADMAGMVCVVTGGRVRIGYQIVLKLLRAGAYVLTTTRYPADAALRYAQEADFADFASRLEVIGPLELSDVGLVERFCDALCARFERIHVLINNAAQTLTRAAGWFARMDAMEAAAAAALPAPARRVLIDTRPLLNPIDANVPAPMLTWNETDAADCAAAALAASAEAGQPGASSPIRSRPSGGAASSRSAATDNPHTPAATDNLHTSAATDNPHTSAATGNPHTSAAPHTSGADGVVDSRRGAPSSTDENAGDGGSGSGVSGSGEAFRVVRGHMVGGFDARDEQAAFPVHRLDESAQPLDLSAQNSWSRKLGEVSTSELLHTVAANTVAPFVLCGRLRAVLSPTAVGAAVGGGGDGVDTKRWGHIVNVSALEGKFGVAKKQSCHPHTNMAKAALNMLTCSSAIGLYQEQILINSVDTGWVTDMAPGGVGVLAATHETQVGPPLDEVDGAARVLDPIFSHLMDNKWTMRGRLWKDYKLSAW